MSATPQNIIRDVVDYELLFDCVHCGLCLEACPTYVLTRAEMDSPRGRIYLMKSLAESRLALDEDVVRHLDLCLGCRGCETACPSGVKYGRLIEGARGYIERKFRRDFGERLKRGIVSALFPFPWRLRLALAPIRLLDLLGLRALAQRLAPQDASEWMDLLPAPSSQRKEDQIRNGASAAGGKSVLLHRGCVTQVMADSANRSTKALLAAADYVVKSPELPCCGALDLHNGNTERALKFARRNVRAMSAAGCSAIVSAASGCAATIAEYGQLLKNDSELATAAAEISSKVSDLSTLLLKSEFSPNASREVTVAYHDSCHLVHGLGVREGPRRLLRAVPGARLVEMAESDLCCGSAGSYNLTQPQMARDLGMRKADRIEATGADFVVMANPGCQFQIAAELKRRGSKVRAVHLADFLAQALDRR